MAATVFPHMASGPDANEMDMILDKSHYLEVIFVKTELLDSTHSCKARKITW